QNSKLTRSLLKESGNILTTSLDKLLLFFGAYILLYNANLTTFKKNILFIIFAFYCVFTYEREPIVLLLLLILFIYIRKINYLLLTILGISSYFILTFFKPFYIIVIGLNDWGLFFDVISKS